MNTDKKYHKEVAVFVVLLVAVIVLSMFMANNSSKGIEKYCNENPSYCAPANYPGKVVQ